MHNRKYSSIDKLCLNLDKILKTFAGSQKMHARHISAHDLPQPDLTPEERKHAAGLMRVNHTGEVCAQALYQGQALVSRNINVKEKMQQAMIEEEDHLAWCEQRITELGSHTSYLNPFWYLGSFAIGVTAGLVGDKWSLGFLAETEHQVVKHLQSHLNILPANDIKSYKIIEQMQLEEAAHQKDAENMGAANLPQPVKQLMGLLSKMMVKVTYWI